MADQIKVFKDWSALGGAERDANAAPRPTMRREAPDLDALLPPITDTAQYYMQIKAQQQQRIMEQMQQFQGATPAADAYSGAPWAAHEQPLVQQPYNPYNSQPLEQPYNPYQMQQVEQLQQPYNPYQMQQTEQLQQPYNPYQSQQPYNPYQPQQLGQSQQPYNPYQQQPQQLYNPYQQQLETDQPQMWLGNEQPSWNQPAHQTPVEPAQSHANLPYASLAQAIETGRAPAAGVFAHAGAPNINAGAADREARQRRRNLGLGRALDPTVNLSRLSLVGSEGSSQQPEYRLARASAQSSTVERRAAAAGRLPPLAQLGKLGPDLDTDDHQQKLLKMERLRAYSVHLRNLHRTNLVNGYAPQQQQASSAPTAVQPASQRLQRVDQTIHARRLREAAELAEERQRCERRQAYALKVRQQRLQAAASKEASRRASQASLQRSGFSAAASVVFQTPPPLDGPFPVASAPASALPRARGETQRSTASVLSSAAGSMASILYRPQDEQRRLELARLRAQHLREKEALRQTLSPARTVRAGL